MKTCTVLATSALVGLSATQGIAGQSLLAIDSMSYLLSTDYACGNLVQQCPKKDGGDANDETFGFLAKFGGLNGVRECFQNNIEEIASRPTCGGELKSTYSLMYPDSETAYVGALESAEVDSVFIQSGSTTTSGSEMPLIAGAGAAGFVGIAAVAMLKKKNTNKGTSGSYKNDGALAPGATEFELEQQPARGTILSKQDAIELL